MFDPSDAMAELLREDKRYRFDAYVFVFEALSFAQNVLGLGSESPSEPMDLPEAEPSDEPEGPQQHVSGQDLCEAIRQYALKQYGYMAKIVLNSWGVRKTGDFGEIVFNLIRIGRMRRTADDCREDFQDVFDFDTAFREEFKITPAD